LSLVLVLHTAIHIQLSLLNSQPAQTRAATTSPLGAMFWDRRGGVDGSPPGAAEGAGGGAGGGAGRASAESVGHGAGLTVTVIVVGHVRPAGMLATLESVQNALIPAVNPKP
jgi:hypothetical protein